MADKTRKLAHGEKLGSVFSSEKGRDRADARRQIAGLNLADQQVQAQQQGTQALGEQTMYLKYMAERLMGIEQLLRELVDQGRPQQPAFQPPPPPSS